MGGDRIRHLVVRQYGGFPHYYWQPSATIASLGLSAETLGTDYTAAKTRALELNALADEMRREAKTGTNGLRPGSIARLFAAYQASDEFQQLKPRTRAGYAYYLGKIEVEFGEVMVRALSPRVVKTYYKRVKHEVSVTWAYHILSTLRAVLSWAVSEDWIPQNPALDVKMEAPKRRSVIWRPEQAAAYIAKARDMGWHSLAVMAFVFDSIGQSPIDVITLKRRAYDGSRIDVTRAKTGVTDAPIPLFPEARKALDEYLAAQPAKLPDAPLFTNDRIGGQWNQSTLIKTHAKIRKAADLPGYLQLQDFRTTVQTEGGAAGGTVDELRGLARHATRSAAEHYVYPDDRFVESIQQKRLAQRNKKRKKVGC